MNNKKFLVDTSVILDDPQNLISLFQGGLNEVYISDVILSELNGHKEDGFNEKGFFAREFIRALDKGILTKRNDVIVKKVRNKKRLSKRIEVERIKEGEDIIYGFSCLFENKKEPILIYIINREQYKKESNTNDLKIVEIASDYSLDLITNDIALKIIALSKGVHSESLKKDTVNNPEDIEFKKEYSIKESEKEKFLETIKEQKIFSQIILSILNEDGTDTGKKEFYLIKENHVIEQEGMDAKDFEGYPIQPLNLEQKFLLKMLSLPEAEIAVVTGSTGSGKTLMVLQEGLRRVKDPEDNIDGIVYLRNTVNSNDKASELGFRKGDQNQKLNYFAYPLFGNINFITQHSFSKKKRNLKDDYQDNNKSSTSKEEHTEQFMKDYNIEVMDLAHARGVTLSNKFVIFDELQNASNSTLQLLGTRLGKNSRLVLMGDYRQVDHPYLTKQRNALVTMLQKATKSDKIAAIQLRKTIRSDIANWFQENL